MLHPTLGPCPGARTAFFSSSRRASLVVDVPVVHLQSSISPFPPNAERPGSSRDRLPGLEHPRGVLAELLELLRHLVHDVLGGLPRVVHPRTHRVVPHLVSHEVGQPERVVDVPRGGRRGRGWRVRARRQRRQDDHDGEDGEEDDSHRLLRRLGGARGHHPSPCRCRSRV